MISNNQRGMSSLNMLFVLVIAAGVALFLFKVIPAQFNNTYIVNALKSLKNPDGPLSDISDRQIRKQMSSFFSINNVDSKLLQRIEIDRDNDRPVVSLNYEVRETFYRNIEIVTVFENQWDSNSPQTCCKSEK